MTSIEHPKLMQALGLGADLLSLEATSFYVYSYSYPYDNWVGYSFGGTPALTLSTVSHPKG